MKEGILTKAYLIGLSILCLVLFYYQVVEGEYFLQRSKNNYVKVIPLRSLRGGIFDTNGIALAYDKAMFNIAVIPHQIRKNKNVLFTELTKFSNLKFNEIEKKYKRNLKNIFTPVDIIVNLPKKEAILIKDRFSDSVLINPQPQRFYNYPYSFSQILGYVKEAAAIYEDVKKYGYQPSERVGFSGIEQFYNSYLRGEEGGNLIEVGAGGNIVGFLGKRESQKGKDIMLTIDSRIQEIAYEELKEYCGSIIMLDVNDGSVYTLVSSPSYNPNNFIQGKDVAQFLKDPNHAMVNRTIQAQYPIGSVFKPLLGLTALEENKINPNSIFKCKGYIPLGKNKKKCWTIHGDENLYDALAHSCNVYFYNLGKKVGIKPIVYWTHKYGLTQQTQIDIPYEKKGFFPNPRWKKNTLKQEWFIGDTYNISIGQGYIKQTPLNMLVALSMFANKGFLIKPHLLKNIEKIDSQRTKKTSVPVKRKNLDIIAQGMIQCVTRIDGTAHLLDELQLKIAGKTSTTQTQGRSHGWFIGFFPYDNPKYSICVMLENAGSSHEAVKVTYSFLKKLKENNLIL